jgi:Mce-associated membrane protein
MITRIGMWARAVVSGRWLKPAGAAVGRRPRRTLAVLGLLVVAVIAFATYGHFHYAVADQRTDAVQRTVAAQAGTLVATVLSYDAKTVDIEVEQAERHLTGAFLASYSKVTSDTVIPQAKQQGVDSKWNVSGTSVMSANSDSAEVLVFLRGVTTSAQNPHPTYLVSSVRVHVVKRQDQWLIDRMEPL